MLNRFRSEGRTPNHFMSGVVRLLLSYDMFILPANWKQLDQSKWSHPDSLVFGPPLHRQHLHGTHIPEVEEAHCKGRELPEMHSGWSIGARGSVKSTILER